MIEKLKITKANESGKNIFQHNRISWSTRYLGKEARTQIKKKSIKQVLKPKKRGKVEIVLV